MPKKRNKYRYPNDVVSRLARICYAVARMNGSEDTPIVIPANLRAWIKNTLGAAETLYKEDMNVGIWVGPLHLSEIGKRMKERCKDPRTARDYLHADRLIHQDTRLKNYVRIDGTLHHRLNRYGACFNDLVPSGNIRHPQTTPTDTDINDSPQHTPTSSAHSDDVPHPQSTPTDSDIR